MDSLRNEEFDLKRTLEALDTRRIRNSGRLCELHTSLRDREHHLCLEVWAAIQAERHSRRALETASADVVHVKDLLSQALEYVHYRGVVRAAPYKKVFFNSWHRSNVEITGLALIVEPLNKCLEECSTKDYFKKSFSMSFQSSKTPKSSSKTLSKYTKDNSEGTHYSTYDTNHPGGSEAEDADGETDGSSGATSYARDAMMAAHALGRDGLPESTCGGKNKPFISYSTGPVRRKLQKLHESGVQRRIIPVQDIIAVEVSKIDKSLGPCYVQVELRIHYFKEGQQRLTAHSLLFSPQQSATSRVSVIGADGTTTETRERLMSSSSTASANGSIRSTSTNSASGAASTLAAGVVAGAGAGVLASPHRPLGMKTQGSASKTRSISTGGASLGFESFSASTKNTSAGGGATSTATVSSAAAAQVPAIASIPPEKLDTVWFKLPMQSNTISRSVATGKSRSKTAGLDDGTEGPTLTFELFVAILRRVRDGIKIFSCSSNGVETLYRVNPAFGDVPPSKSSSTSTAAAVATSESAMATEIASPSPGMHRKVSSSGNLCGELGAGVYSQPLATASPQRTHGKSAASLRSGDKSEDTYGYGGDLRSYSPKRSTSSTSTAAARLSSSCNSTSSSYPTSSYQGGSMNSASGLTSIESLVGITSLRGNGSSRTSLSASTSTSASMSSSSTSYNTASSLSMKGGSSNSPRFEYKYLGDDTVQEETTADLQDMNDDDDEGAFSDFSMPRVVSQQALNDEQDDDDKEAPRRFLKLTRRATEGDQALSKGPSFHAGSSSSSAAAQYLDGESEDIRGASFSSFRVDLSDPGMCGSALLVEDCDYDVATTRHTISSYTIPAQMNSTSRNSSSRHLLASVAAGAAATSGAAQGSAPGSPRHRNSFSCDTAVATTVAAHSSKENLLDNVDSQKCFSAPIVPLRRTDSRTSVEARNSAFAAQSAKRGTADTNTSTCAGLSKKHGSSATMAPEDMIRYPAKLARLLEKTRSKRSKIQSRCVLDSPATQLFVLFSSLF